MPSSFHPLLVWFRTPRPTLTRVRPQLVSLEDRSVPATVNILADVVDAGDGKTSLREAVAEFNADPDSVLGTTTISFDSALGKGPTFTLTLGELAVTGKAGATNKLLTLTNSDPTEIVIKGSGAARLFNVGTDAQLAITGPFLLTSGKADKGGAIFTASKLTLNNVRVSGNQAADGGGLYIETTGALSVSNSVIENNRAATGNGGGILDNGSTSVLISHTLIQKNIAVGDGGGILGGNVAMVNTTITGNTAGGDGGGTWTNGQLFATNSTIVLNRADSAGVGAGKGGGVFISSVVPAGTAVLSNTLIGGNTVGTGTTASDVDGSLIGTGSETKNNLIADPATAGGLTNGTNGNIVGNGGAAIAITSIINTTLATNGGLGPDTHALVAGSPALDKGDKTLALVPGTTTALSSDQRGSWAANVGKSAARVAGTEVDIGAFELQNTPPQVTGPTNTITLVEDGPGVSFTGANLITVTDDAFATPSYAVELTIPAGTLTLGTTTGLTGLTGNNSKEIKFNSATLASLNAALGSLSFAPTTNQYGQVGLTVTVDDGDTTAPGGAQSAFGTAASITIDAVIDTPTVTNATTAKDTTALVTFTRNAADGGEVSFFKVTNVKNIATLTYDSDGLGKTVTITANTTFPFSGEFFALIPDAATKITVTPVAGFEGFASFNIQAAIGQWPGNTPGSPTPVFGGPILTSTITVGTPPADTTAPTAALGTAPDVNEASNKTQYDFTVTFNDNVAISFATIDGKDVRITGPNGFDQLATLVSVDVSGDGAPRTATYRITAPGGTWDAADNGTYTVKLEASQVADTSGNTAAAADLGTFRAALTRPGGGTDTKAPTATSSPTPIDDTSKGAATYDFIVTYTDDVSVNVGSLDGQDIRVSGPNGFDQLATFVRATPAGNGTPRTATYRITAPGGTWDFADNGTYTVKLEAGQVADTSGNTAVATDLGTFTATLTRGGDGGTDTKAPTATSSPAAIDDTSKGAATYEFTVTYTDDVSVNVGSLDGNDIRVTGPNRFDQLATFVRATPAGDGTPRTATYRITAPGGTWDFTDNGTYTVALEAGQVSDPSRNSAAAATLGTFTATLTRTGTGTQPNPTRVGYPQFAVGADRGGNGSVQFFNPDKSSRLTDPLTPFGRFTGGVRVAAGDVNGDGVADIVVGTGPGRATQVKVIDGATLRELFSVDPFEASFTGGVFVAVGDLNGDGFADIVITPDEGGGPRARVFSGNRFTQMADFFGIEDVAFRGGARAGIGDITGDGKADLVVAAGFGGGPRVGVFDGAKLAAEGALPDNQTFSRWNTWKPFGDFLAFEPALRNGTYVAVGDIDGDGFSELIAGGGPGGGPRVTAFSGKELLTSMQTPLANFFAGDVNNRGGIRVAVKNLDGDAKADLVVGAGPGGGSRVTSYLGANLATVPPPSGFDFDAIAGFTGGVFVG